MIFWCFWLVVVWFGSKVEFFLCGSEFRILVQWFSKHLFSGFLWGIFSFFLEFLLSFSLKKRVFLSFLSTFFFAWFKKFFSEKLEFFHSFILKPHIFEWKKILCMCFLLNNNKNNDTRCMFVHLKCKFRFLFWVFFQYFFISGFVKCRWRLRFSDWYDDSIKNSLHEFFVVVVLPNNKQTNRRKKRKKRKGKFNDDERKKMNFWKRKCSRK